MGDCRRLNPDVYILIYCPLEDEAKARLPPEVEVSTGKSLVLPDGHISESRPFRKKRDGCTVRRRQVTARKVICVAGAGLVADVVCHVAGVVSIRGSNISRVSGSSSSIAGVELLAVMRFDLTLSFALQSPSNSPRIDALVIVPLLRGKLDSSSAWYGDRYPRIISVACVIVPCSRTMMRGRMRYSHQLIQKISE